MRTPTMFPGEPFEERFLKVELPLHVCNICGTQMGHLAGLGEIDVRPAEGIFLCRQCADVVDELP